MTDTFKWRINDMQRELSDGTVLNVTWTLDLNRVTENGHYNAGQSGTIGLNTPDPGSFTPYLDLTESQVVSWVQAYLLEENPNKITEIENYLTDTVDELEKPTKGQGLPWVDPCAGVICPTGFHCENGVCVENPPAPTCPPGEEYNPATGQCEPIPS